MANKTQTIRIESILGGHSQLSNYANPDQFRSSLGINPSLPVNDDEGVEALGSSGLLRPTPVKELDPGTIKRIPFWIKANPKNNITYVYTNCGSIYTTTGSTISELGDLNDGGQSLGNGMAYYDNYMYFARETTIARYGPLNGSPTFTDDYWSTTLSKTALTSQAYPSDPTLGFSYPNHVMHRHSDGRLYIADVQDGKGVLHYVQTTKTSVEGDTDAGSKYLALEFGYGLFPTAIESYGDTLVIALVERRDGNYNNGDSYTGAKLAFWDTISNKANFIIWNAISDGFISALKNVNGILYVVSGSFNNYGYRVSRYLGGESLEQIFYSEFGQLPTPGAVDGDGNRLLFGSNTGSPLSRGCIWSYGLQGGQMGVFNVQSVTSSSAVSVVTAFSLPNNNYFLRNVPDLVGWSQQDSTSLGNNGIDIPQFGVSGSYGNSKTIWWSQVYKIGKKFKITKIRIPVPYGFGTGSSVTPKIYVDDYYWSDSTNQLIPIDTTNYPNGAFVVNLRSYANGKSIVGEHSFWLELNWTGTGLTTIGFPIEIEYEVYDD